MANPIAAPRLNGSTGQSTRAAMEWYALEPDPIEQPDVGCIVGKAHDESSYYDSGSLMRLIRSHALWQDMPVAP